MKQNSSPTDFVRSTLAALFAVAVGCYGGVAFAQTTTTTTTTTVTIPDFEPQNIILILSDDVELNDLPFFGTELTYWDDEDDPAIAGVPGRKESRRTHWGEGQLEARLYAEVDGANNGKLGRRSAAAPRIIPVDLDGPLDEAPDPNKDTTAADFAYVSGACTTSTNCERHKDILSTHGGFRRMALESAAVFPRYYSAAATCAPSRGALLTGRHTKKLGMDKFSAALPADEVTIAEFLKQGCNTDGERLCVDWDDPAFTLKQCDCFMDSAKCTNTSAACYTTGGVGKWHIGHGTRGPVQQGFDEFIGPDFGSGFLKGSRHALRDYRCSPDTNRYCQPPATGGTGSESYIGEVCKADADCTAAGEANGICPAVPGFYLGTPVGLYLGPEASDECTGAPAVSNPLCCAPVAKPTLAKVQSGQIYRSKKKGFKDRKDSTAACYSDGDVDVSGCPFYTRMARDHAVNFIKRHKDDGPFFLYVSLTEMHFPRDATARVLAHYTQDDRPGKVEKLLAMAEELDAAIGGIMQALVDAEIEDQTVVIYTSDHGQQRQFGNPNFGRGKSTIAEGGTRVGLIVHAPGPLNGFTPAQSALEEQLVSEVDVFPTIAHFARYDRVGALDPSDGRVTPLYSGGCSPGTAACARETDGRSLLTAMFQPQSKVHRDAVFLREPYDKKSKEGIVTRAGFVDTLNTPGCNATGDPDYCDYAKGVCGVDDLETETFCGSGSSANTGGYCTSNVDCRSTEPFAEGVCEARTVRRIRAASVEVCDPDDPISTSACQQKTCLIEGGLCMTSDEYQGCDEPNEVCDINGAMERCVKTSDCPADHTCRTEILLHCDGCYSAEWKLLDGDGPHGARLVDLATNPEENALYSQVSTANITLDFAWAAQCANPTTCPAVPVSGQTICNVKRELFCALAEWHGCTVASTEEHCDSESLPDWN